MGEYCLHEKMDYDCLDEYYLLTWSIPEASSNENLNFSTEEFTMKSGCSYHANVGIFKDELQFTIISTTASLKCFVSMFIRSETLLFSSILTASDITVYSDYQYLLTLSSENECFQKFKLCPNDSLVLICRIKYPANGICEESVKMCNTFCNLKKLASALKNSPESYLNEKVILQVGEKTENISKAVLCARSPVFAKMFQNDKKKLKENIVTIIDIKMDVVKALVAFLYVGKLTNNNLDFLCELYCASDKYDIADLRQACVDLLLPQISMTNMIRVLKFSFSYNDIQLKSKAMTVIAANIKTWVSTDDWRKLINDEPKIAIEVLSFFDF